MPMRNDCKISSLLSPNDEDMEAFKKEFAPYPNGMEKDTFLSVLSRHVLQRRDHVRFTQRLWSNYSGGARSQISLMSSRSAKYAGPVGADASFAGNSVISNSRMNNKKYSASQGDALGTLREEVSMGSITSLRANNTLLSQQLRRSTGPWINVNALEMLFNKIDSDSDGLVSWDDVLQLAVEEATQSMTIIKEESRSYSLSRVSPQMRLIQLVHTLPEHKSMFAVVSRATPLTLMSKRDISVIKEFSFADLGNTHPQLIEYLSVPDVLLSYSANDKMLRGWWNVVSANRMGTLNPSHAGDTIRRIRTQSKMFPYSFFTCGGSGNIVHWQVPKQRSVLDMTRVHSYDALHPHGTGGITDFILTDESVFSTGFDRRLLSTNLETGRSICIGIPSETIRFLEYNRSYECLPTVSYSNKLLLWDVRSSAVTPGTTFRDEGARPHTADVIGLCNAPGLPQIITCDSAGLMKVWDLRTLQCAQTLYIDGSAVDDINVDTIYDEKVNGKGQEVFAFRSLHKGDTHCIRSLGVFPNMQEIVCNSSESIYCVRYNHRQDGRTADVEPVLSAFYDLRQNTIILQGATRTSVWDATEGFRRRVFDRTIHTNVPYWKQEVLAVCLDYPRNRLFFAMAEGIIEVRSSKNFALLETFVMPTGRVQEMLYTSRHKLLVSISVSGILTLRQEEDSEPSFSHLGLSSKPLRALSLSDEAGIIACCDESSLYFVDYKQTRPYLVTIELVRPVRTTAMLGRFPVLLTSREDGELTFWSTPPAEESHMELLSFVSQSSNRQWRIGTEKAIYDPRQLPAGRPQVGFTSTTSSYNNNNYNNDSTALPSPDVGDDQSQVELSDFPAGLKKEKKKNGFSELLELLAADDRMSEAFTSISFDDVSHHLFLADNKGRLLIYSLCRFLQGFGLRRCSFRKRTRYHLKGLNSDFKTTCLPVLLRTVSAHKGPSTFMGWFPALNAVISCGDDRLVKVIDSDGNETGQLLMDRLPARRNFDDAEEEAAGANMQWERQPAATLLPFSLPPPSRLPEVPCKECARIAKKLKGRRHSSAEGTCEEAPQLQAVERGHGGSPGSSGGAEALLPQLGAFLGGAAEDCSNTQVRETTLSQSPPPSMRLVALEEKKKWRPRREEPRAFRETVYGPVTSNNNTNNNNSTAEVYMEQGADRRRHRLASSKPMTPVDEWWKPVTLPITSTMKSRQQYSGPMPSFNNTNTTTATTIDNSNISSGARWVDGDSEIPPTVRSGLGEGLALSGISMAPGGSSKHLKPLGISAPAGSNSVFIPTKKTVRGDWKNPLKKNGKKKLAFKNKTYPQRVVEGETEEGAEGFLDKMLRTYEKELHRCVRGQSGMDRLCKSNRDVTRKPVPSPTLHNTELE